MASRGQKRKDAPSTSAQAAQAAAAAIVVDNQVEEENVEATICQSIKKLKVRKFHNMI